MPSTNQNNNAIRRRNRRLHINRRQTNRNIRLFRLLRIPSSINNLDMLRRIQQLPPQNTDDEFARQLFFGSTFY